MWWVDGDCLVDVGGVVVIWGVGCDVYDDWCGWEVFWFGVWDLWGGVDVFGLYVGGLFGLLGVLGWCWYLWLWCGGCWIFGFDCVGFVVLGFVDDVVVVFVDVGCFCCVVCWSFFDWMVCDWILFKVIL